MMCHPFVLFGVCDELVDCFWGGGVGGRVEHLFGSIYFHAAVGVIRRLLLIDLFHFPSEVPKAIIINFDFMDVFAGGSGEDFTIGLFLPLLSSDVLCVEVVFSRHGEDEGVDLVDMWHFVGGALGGLFGFLADGGGGGGGFGDDVLTEEFELFGGEDFGA
jgi:hypothetical protein